MQRQMQAVLLAVVLVGQGVLAAEIAREHPDERLAANVVEVVDQINSGDRAGLERFVRERYGAEMLRGMTVETTADFLMGVHESKSPIELCCYRLSDQIPEGMAVAVLRAGASDTWSTLQVRFDEADKITSFMIVPAKPPAGFANLTKLDDAGLAREFDAYLLQLAAKDEFSGAVLIARDGKPLFKKAYGLANREHDVPNRTDTRFRLGSMNKMFTAVAVAQLVERGQLSFDDPIGKHLPAGWVAPEVGTQVRVRQLLNHTSGLRDYLEPVLERAIYEFSDLEDYREIAASETPAFEPGSKWSYSNTGFLLAGVIVAHVSGMDYFEYIRRNVYGPAGMKSSDHYDHTIPTPGLADGYFRHEGEIHKNTLLLAPRGTSAGGGYSTVEDLLAFDIALRSEELLSAEMRDWLFTPDPERNSPSYGYGFMVHELAPDWEVGHGGTFPGTTAQLAMFLDSGYTFVALCNGLGAQAAYNKAIELIERAKQ